MLYFYLVVLLGITATTNAQLAHVFADQDESACSTWESWSTARCIWIRGEDGNRTDPWNQPYFSQLSPTCRANKFYKAIKKSYGDIVENAMSYFRSITMNKRPCGYCSYKQVCGTGCKGNSKNVLERRCTSSTEHEFCTTNPDLFGSVVPKDCNLWPTKRVDLTGIRQPLRDFVEDFKLFNCVKGQNFLTANQCICCCRPFTPDLALNKCVLRTGSTDPDANRGAGRDAADAHDAHGHTHDGEGEAHSH